jgi:CRP/FNR family transcriptional regulator, cyclic AMP receptor protein
MFRNIPSTNRTTWSELFAGVGQRVYVPAGSLLFRAGEPPRVAIVAAGVVRVFVHAAPRRQLTIRYARAGDLVGVAPLLSRTQMWNAEAVTDTAAEVLSESDVRTLAAPANVVAWAVAEDVAAWAAELVRSVAELSGQPMATRVARHIREIAQVTSEGSSVAYISQQRLADAVGTAREIVSRELGRLRTAGVVTTTPGRIVVLDSTRLDRIAAGNVDPVQL